MNSSDWEMIWRRQELPVGETADVAKLRDTFERTRRHQARALWLRDLIEIVASLFVAGAFGATARELPRGAWLAWMATAVVLGVGAIFVWERFRVRRMRVAASAPLLTKLEADIAELRHQRRLLMNVATWYLAPLAAATLLFAAAIGLQIAATPAAREVVRHWWVIAAGLLYVAFCVGLFLAIWRMNRTAVRKQIDPRLAELEKLRRSVSTDEPSD